MVIELNRKIREVLDRTFYPDVTRNWDNEIFRELVLENIDESTVLLDIGAGRGNLPQMNFKDLVQHAVGVDPDEAINSNPYLDEAYVGFGNSMPFLRTERFDVVVSNNVLEHISDPESYYREVARVVKKGGVFITKTPNIYHYMPTIARITPFFFHKFITGLMGTESHDTFPTRYQANSKKAQRNYGLQSGFKIHSFIFKEGRPEYLRTFCLTYMIGLVYERIVNALKIEQLKIVMFTVMIKK